MMLSQALTFISAVAPLLSHRSLFAGGSIKTPAGERIVFFLSK